MRGFICGAFDLLHPGHLYTLREAKKYCDTLIVGLHVDPSYRKGKNHPCETVFERYTRLKSCKYVDQIIPYESEEDLENMLYILDLDVRFLDADYIRKPEPITGEDIIPIHYIARYHTYSSSELRKRLK